MFAYGYKEGLSQAGNATSVRLREICSPSLPTCLTAESAPSHNSPDKNAGASHDKFQAIQGAYEVLADADQREAYDRYGLSGDEDESNWEDADVDIHEFFAQMFGGPSGFGSADPPPYYGARAGPSNGAAKPKKSKGDDQVVDYSVSLEDCYMGKEVTLELEKAVICSICTGCVEIYQLFVAFNAILPQRYCTVLAVNEKQSRESALRAMDRSVLLFSKVPCFH